jgi:hypothetical protein
MFEHIVSGGIGFAAGVGVTALALHVKRDVAAKKVVEYLDSHVKPLVDRVRNTDSSDRSGPQTKA